MKSILRNVTFLFFICAFVLSGCGTIKSTSSNPGIASTPGVSYYLPAQRTKAELYRNRSSDANPIYMLQISSGPTYPDTSKKYTINYKPSVFNDEHLCVARTTEGLLSTVQFSSTSRAGDILIRVAETAAMVALAAGGVPAPTPSLVEATVTLEKEEELELLRNLIRFTETKPDSSQFDLIYTGIFDNQIEIEIKAVKKQITGILKNELEFRKLKRAAQISEWEQSKRKNRNLSDPRPKELKFNSDDLEISFSKIGAHSDVIASGNDNVCESANNNSAGGVIYYRTLTSQPIEISLKHEYGEIPLGSVSVPAISQSADQCINVERALLVRKVNRLDFTTGLLTGASINTPSVALAAAELPLRIGSAVIEMPASFFTAIGRSFTAQTASVGREIELINALERLRLAKDKPDTASNITVQAPSGEPPKIGVTLTSLDPYKPLGGLSNVVLTCWDGKSNDNR